MVSFVEREVSIKAPSTVPISLSAVSYNPQQYHAGLFHQWDISRPNQLINALDKRCSDYLAGRIAGKAVIKRSRIGFQTLDSSVQIESSRDGVPVFPEDIIGSISHSGRVALAAISTSNHLSSVGIDIEKIVSEEDYDLVKRQVLTHDELFLLEQASINNTELLTLIFSAKESLFKCLYPEVKRFFDFNAAKIISVEPTAHGTNDWSCFTIELLEPLSDNLSIGRRFTGFYRHYPEHIITLIVAY